MSGECTLLDIPCGEKARIRSLTGRDSDRSRLCALGFTPGTEVEVSRCGGGRRVRIRNTCVMLDAGIAGTIVCDHEQQKSSPEREGCCNGQCTYRHGHS